MIYEIQFDYINMVRMIYDKIRYLIYNILTEINLCTVFSEKLLLYHRLCQNKPEYLPLYRLATDKYPFYVPDAQRTPEGLMYSNIIILLSTIKDIMWKLINYPPKIIIYIKMLKHSLMSLNNGLKLYRDFFIFLITPLI